MLNITNSYGIINQTHSEIKLPQKDLKEVFVNHVIAPLFTTGKKWKQPKYPLTNEWINKVWYLPTVGHYSAYNE